MRLFQGIRAKIKKISFFNRKKKKRKGGRKKKYLTSSDINWNKGVKCKDTGEVIYSYQHYLQSNHWRRMRRHYYKEHEKKCELCKAKKNIHLHHRTYKRIGNEKMSDFHALCSECHSMVHKLANNPVDKKYNLENCVFTLKRERKIKRITYGTFFVVVLVVLLWSLNKFNVI